MSYSLLILPVARQELDTIIGWIAKRSPDGASRLLLQFEHGLQSLSENPESHSLAPESHPLGRDIRQMFFKTRRGLTYRALFDIQGVQVRVLRIRCPGQRLLRRREI